MTHSSGWKPSSQSQKMQAIGQLAGGIAHEFNNILAVILGYGQVMQKGLEPGSTNMSDLEQILTAAERAASLTKGLLAFSRKQQEEQQVLDLCAAVRREPNAELSQPVGVVPMPPRAD